ncbi:hypothetical protein O181_059322 [Austropuccinia psidii MF-1]|uniref:RNase H type-1 domain-containing protein n=1 Tax=Austropuccinia psidii MF-1 TaxID=1389203 RepID=A0A9Q3EGF6_9BASI|nr:hypothetical protein [Austropuccinia psidii MF-1]
MGSLHTETQPQNKRRQTKIVYLREETHPHAQYYAIPLLYNTPPKFEALEPLKSWLANHSIRGLPTLIAIDSNLHHPIWNPPRYHHSHSEAKILLKIMEGKSFYLSSPPGIPTFLGRRGSATTIDHLWANSKARKLITSNHVQLNNHASDHQPISTTISLNFQQTTSKISQISMNLSNLDRTKFKNDVRHDLKHPPSTTENLTNDNIDNTINNLTNIIRDNYFKQGRRTNFNETKHKPWWDENILTPLVRGRNRAQKWALVEKSAEAKNCYQAWQLAFKIEIKRLKTEHWRKFLAEKSPNHVFQAYKFTKLSNSGNILPLRNNEGNMILDNKTKAKILFEGTSVINNQVDTSDIAHIYFDPQFTFPPITTQEIARALEELPKKKAPGPDQIANELLKETSFLLAPHLEKVFNSCLRNGYFPTSWKKAVTAIIRKAGKDDYSDPKSYRPIALLNTLGKLFEKIINDRLSFWAEHTGTLANGHMGGRPGRSIYDAFVILTSWIKAQWRKGRLVMGLFLDSFLLDRYTVMKLDSYFSDPIAIERGLPQGSPLSVTLYLLYNSGLLIDNSLSLENQEISLGFIDDVVHLVSDLTVEKTITRLQERGKLSLDWGMKNGAIFDKKKAKAIIFSHKRITSQEPFVFGDQEIEFEKEVKWLGLILDQRLFFKKQVVKAKSSFTSSFNQLMRIIKVTYGISIQEAKQLISAVIQSRVLYGSLVWFTKRNERSISTFLETAHHKCIRLATGFLKQTPIAFLKHDGVLKSLISAHTRLSHNYIYRTWTLPPNHPVKSIVRKEIMEANQTHLSPISLVIRKEELSNMLRTNIIETIYPKPMAPWLPTLNTPLNLQLTREDAKKQIKSQILKETEKNSIIIFTDGSLIPEQGAGAAALLINTNKNKSCFIGTTNSVSNFEAELIGIQLAADLIQEEIINNINTKSAAIFSDSQGALIKSTNPYYSSSGQHIYVKTFNKLRKLKEKLELTLYWCPGHEEIEGNCKVDLLAKEATVNNNIDNQNIIPSSLSKLRQHAKHITPILPPLTEEEKKRVKFKTERTRIAEKLSTLEKGIAALIYQLRAGHVPLNDYLTRIKSIQNNKCPNCGRRETINHYLLYCYAYKKERYKFRKNIIKNKSKTNFYRSELILDSPDSFEALGKYILDTKRFPHIRTYREDQAVDQQPNNSPENRV